MWCLNAPAVKKAANDALLAIKKRGQFTQIGLYGKPIAIDFERMCFKELKVTGSIGSAGYPGKSLTIDRPG